MTDSFHLKANDELINDYSLPRKFVPGTDLISKAVLTNDEVINILCKSVNNSPQDHYMAAPSEFFKSACDVLYLPKMTLSEYSPIIVEVQKVVNEKYMSRATRYSTLVYEKYNKYPIVLIIGVSAVTTPVASKLTTAIDYPYCLEVPCLFWAKRCLIMSSITLSKIDRAEQLASLAAIGIFLCSQKVSIAHLDYASDNSTMQLLYKVARIYVEQLAGEEAEKAEAINAICDNTANQIEKIKRHMQQGDETAIEKAMLYLDDTVDYLKRQKRKYTAGRETTPIPDTPPIKYLKSTQSNRTAYNNFSELNDYIKRFRSEKTGRISWVECFKQGHEEKKAVIMEYKTTESLRGYYNKHIKSFTNSTIPSTSINTMPSISTISTMPSAPTNTNTCETLQK
ncbi:hypothetical protein BDF20DRAFT_976172 [Mycotypha africana]|uniref:uncharacterized protein n=1 Tax=Mycotypha africana TaxID=64632 RepID=UPI002300A225|nr:uncharacterized protein BDF20DRAFT_976172 [Mycotypha africana]KAI8977666.1 hypothetical protein BDF20DRAFT_976172 [Mycotypha africana]